jgi:molybdopterin molybdotransferase
MVLITGGSSVGTKDMTAKIINDLGKPGVLFHGVSLKPGKPMIGGIIQGKPVFGLPGHPAAVSVCFEIFIRPVLIKQSGAGEGTFRRMHMTFKARIAKNISSSPGREEHIGVTLEERDGTAVIPLRKLGVQQGDFVEVRLF